MSQHDPSRNLGSTPTMIGLGQREEAAAGLGPLVTKIYNLGGGCGREVVQVFTRQVLRVAKLRHPHVVQVVEAGSDADGTPFVVMERLSGATLEERRGGTRIPPSELLPILRGVASGLAAAHASGVAHGGLRADSVFMADVAGYAHGFPKLLDFGVAGLTAAARSHGHDVVEPSFDAVPPEQRLDLACGDDRSDQWALAALACRFLAREEATPAVEVVLTRAMSWHPSRRFDSVAAFIEALEEAVRAVSQAPLAKVVVEEGQPPQAAQAGSLTQQFFAEGERLEQAAGDGASASGASAGPADSEADDLAVTDMLDRVPRSRVPMLMGLALALTSLTIVGWTALSLSETPPRQESPSAEAPQPPPGAASASAALAITPARTASMALRARTPVRVAARLGHPPTEPPPVPAPAADPTPAATAAPPPTPMANEPSAAATAAPPSIDEGAGQLEDQPASEPAEQTPAAPQL